MANEIGVAFTTGNNVYAQIRNTVNEIWNTVGAVFEAYATANIGDYDIPLTEQGTASGYYVGSFPITDAGAFSIEAFKRVGGEPAESDPVIGAISRFAWNGVDSLYERADIRAISGSTTRADNLRQMMSDYAGNTNILPVQLINGVEHGGATASFLFGHGGQILAEAGSNNNGLSIVSDGTGSALNLTAGLDGVALNTSVSGTGTHFSTGAIAEIQNGLSNYILLQTTIATVNSPGDYLLSNGSSDTDAYTNKIVILKSASDPLRISCVKVTSYDGTTKNLTTTTNLEFAYNPIVGDTVIILANREPYTVEGNYLLSDVRRWNTYDVRTQSMFVIGEGIIRFPSVALETAPSNFLSSIILASGDVDGFTLEETLKLCLSALAGKLSGAGTTTVTIRAADDSKDRITATVDADGNRTAITLDVAG